MLKEPEGTINEEFADETEVELPDGFEWAELSLESDLEELSQFLIDFFDKFTGCDQQEVKQFIQWYLSQSNDPKLKSLFLSVKATKSQKLVGVICGTPISLNIRDTIIDSLDTKILCVHPKFRSKRLSCLLIRELSRKAATAGFKYGHFASLSCVAKPVC